MADNKPEEAFRVIDRRPFTSEGDMRKDVVEAEEREAEREAQREAARHPAPAAAAGKSGAAGLVGAAGESVSATAADVPKASPAFENR